MRISRLLRPRSSGKVVLGKVSVKPAVAAAARAVGLIMAAPDRKMAAQRMSFADREGNQPMEQGNQRLESACMAALGFRGATVKGVLGMRVAGMGVTHVT